MPGKLTLSILSLRNVITLTTLLFIFGCGPKSKVPLVDQQRAAAEARRQRIEALESYLEHNKRLQRVAFPILTKNRDLCGKKVTKHFEFTHTTADFYKNYEHLEAARFVLGVGNHTTVVSVVEGSPADEAGLLPGDRILRLNDQIVGLGKKANKEFVKGVKRSEYSGITLLVERGGLEGIEEHTVVIPPTERCDYKVVLVNSNEINGFANGKQIALTKGMLRFVEDDAELALVIGHEMAHNTRGHVEAQARRKALGGLLGALAGAAIGVYGTWDLGEKIGASMFSEAYEAEADYVGVYHAARAGFDIKNAASMWRRMGTDHPASIDLKGASHPSTPNRFIAIGEAANEVQEKIRSGRLLIPEEKKKK